MGSLEIGNLFELQRIRKDISIGELSENTGISKSVLYRILNGGTKHPSLNTSKKIMNALDIPLGEFIQAFMMFTHRPTTLQVLLTDAISISDKNLVVQIAKKLLEAPGMDTFLALDHIVQASNGDIDQQIKLALCDVVIDYTRQRGIPYYLSKMLYEKYIIERDDFSRLKETYESGKELLHYCDLLHHQERLSLFYRLAVHAYVLEHYRECIELCRRGIREDEEDSKEKATALISMANSYLKLNNVKLAELFSIQYGNSQYADFRKKYFQALLYGKKKRYEEAISLFKECLTETGLDGRINIVTDMLDLYLEIGKEDLIKELLESEDEFLSGDILAHPYRIKNTAKYYERKSLCQLSIGHIDQAANSLFQSIVYYREVGDFKGVTMCISLLAKYHHENKTQLSSEHLEKIAKICHNN
ncbi:helix-turn-helix domain-containing protein [Brevibacillus laterosporus]|uniref:helix-turn-helix domain-containing protein n=1 Tax=Brevibacillus laterosporus TaxID=1465 RepID=UPI0014447641|nr:helix-turn-helix domain-containing protein [Brevibacillus laterosporus]NKQ22769.1 helix-turn-helix transcriptional regulator [Brevibacillus laterosporus]WNX33764.1 helix-turn-helix domain-containing protein [Brevibacillus laterosporus]